MEFRPCIDIHNGKVKQIVGGSLTDQKDFAEENFVSEYDASYYARFYKKFGVTGGHIILLNPPSSDFFEETKRQALMALSEYPGSLQIGGGITDENAASYIEAGASHVIVTSFVFKDGKINKDNLDKLVAAVGKDRIVLDLSCRKKGNEYFIVTDRWQNFTEVTLTEETLDFFASYADEFLIHAVDVEGKASGIELDLITLLGQWNKIPMTYAGGVHSLHDIEELKRLGKNKIHVTVGSALDLFGGALDFQEILACVKK